MEKMSFHWWPLAFLILSPPLQNFHVVLPTKKCLLCFLSLALNPCRPLSRWASLACRPLSLFVFRFRIYWLLCCLCFTRRRWLWDFPSKYPRVAFRLPYLLIELFYIGMPVVRTDGLSGGRTVKGHVITKFSRMGRLLHFLTMVLRWRASRARAPL